jgi:uncharacterized protein (DUF1501 family)
LPRTDLAATELQPLNAWTDGRRMALHPSLAPLKAHFDAGRLATLMNVGTLVQPITLAQYQGAIGVPPKLFSHNDQQSVWQAGATEGATTGWAGRIGDLLLSSNEGTGGALFTSISASGNAVLMSGRDVVQYQVGSSGSVAVRNVFGSPASTQAIKQIMQTASAHPMQRALASTATRSIDADVRVRAALADVPATSAPFAGFDLTMPLGSQLAMIARLIAARTALGVRRQVFFASIGGWDHHDGLIDRQAPLLAQVAASLAAFQDSMTALGLADKVTLFTGSDFGRTLSSNGDGSDHGWGSYHFILGGAVRGQRWYGELPDVAVNGRHDVGGGRLLPAVSVDQYGATLARWMGVPAGELGTVFPNLSRFSTSDLGFMSV